MKKGIILALFGLILLGAGCSAQKINNNQQVLKEPVFSWNIKDSETVILRNGVEIGTIDGVTAKDTSSTDFVLFRQDATYAYFGVKAKSNGYDLGFKKLYRLSLVDNKILPITSSRSGLEHVYVADVSSDNTAVAFINTQYNDLILKNVDGPSERSIRVNNKNESVFIPAEVPWQLGDVHFSPDNSQLAFAFLQYTTDPKNPTVITEAVGNFRIVNVRDKNVPMIDTGYSPSKNKIVRVAGWKNYDDVNYAVEEKSTLYAPFISTGKWQIHYGESESENTSQLPVIAYTGNETVNVWLMRTAPGWNADKEDLILGLDKSSLNKLPVSLRDRGLEEVVLYPGAVDFEQIKKKLQGTSIDEPVQLGIKLFRDYGGQIFISTDLSPLYYKDWKLVRGDFLDTCTSPTFVGKVRVRGWLEKTDCTEREDAYCVPFSFKILGEDKNKLPRNVEVVYPGDDSIKQLEKSSRQNPITVELTRIGWYCEGYQPFVEIGGVL